jgi:ATF/CREB family transcription factor
LYSSENEKLLATVNELRQELVHLKQVMMSHKDCPMMAQNILPNGMATDYGLPTNPYSMSMQANPALQAQGIPRR